MNIVGARYAQVRMNNFQERIFAIFSSLRSSRVFRILPLFILLVTIALTVFIAQKNTDSRLRAEVSQSPSQPSKSSPKSRGYIVEFKSNSLISYQSQAKKSGSKLPLSPDQYKAQLAAEHERAKNDILTRLGKRSFSSVGGDNTVILLREYYTAFNGISLDITKSQAEAIKKSPFVKNVYPNWEVKTSLSESVSLISADKVWQQRDSKKRAITGKGVTVAVLDTGIDYTHQDLGGTKITERNFEQITNEAISPFHYPYADIDQTFSLNNNRLAYYSGNKIYIYSFETKTKTEINLPTDDLKVIRLSLHDNIIAYFATDPNLNNPSIYFYDLTTKTHKKIADNTRKITSLSFSDGKVIYEKDVSTDPSVQLAGIYAFDTVKGDETLIGSLSEKLYLPRVSGNTIVYSVYGSFCYDKIVIYDLLTNQSREVTPPDIGPIIDFEGNKILYVACSKTNPDLSWRTYYLYDISTGEYTKLFYEKDQVGVGNVKSQEFNYIITYGLINKGAIGDGIVYFSKNATNTEKITAYDQDSKRYVLINALKPMYSIDAEGKRVCFLSNDYNIYCHTYDSSDSYSLPDKIFNEKVVGGYNFVDGGGDPIDDNGHGTHVAATIAGVYGSAIQAKGGGYKPFNGVAPSARLIAYKVLNKYGSGWESDVLAALERAVGTRLDKDSSNDIDIVNMSLGIDCKWYFGGFTPDCGPDDAVSRVVDNTVDAGIVVVVAAGNSGPDISTVGSPGTARKAITVGAVDKSKIIASFSARGPVLWNNETIAKPDILAPGVVICAAQLQWGIFFDNKRCFDNKHIAIDGTSMATPHVSGAIALVKQAHPDWPPDKIKQIMKKTAASLGYDMNTQGAGLIDGLNFVLPSPPKVTPTPSPKSICAQVLTPARNLQTNECRVFPNSCIPKGWIRTPSC